MVTPKAPRRRRPSVRMVVTNREISTCLVRSCLDWSVFLGRRVRVGFLDRDVDAFLVMFPIIADFVDFWAGGSW